LEKKRPKKKKEKRKKKGQSQQLNKVDYGTMLVKAG
jgi:hypothetical protein